MVFASRDRTTTINRVIIHHTAGNTTQSAFAALQRNGLSYHAIIDTEGVQHVLVPFERVAFHAGNANGDSIGIALVGQFHLAGNAPNDLQMESLIYLLSELLHTFPTIKNIMPHNEVSATRCPSFDTSGLMQAAQRLQKEAFKIPECGGECEESNHWAYPYWHKLRERGIIIHAKNFSRPATRGEMFAMLDRVLQIVDRDLRVKQDSSE